MKLAQWYRRSCHLKQIIDDKHLTRDKLIGSRLMFIEAECLTYSKAIYTCKMAIYTCKMAIYTCKSLGHCSAPNECRQYISFNA